MIILLMGVSGAGKTTVGRKLSCELGWQFIDGDDLHSAANVEKMNVGIPLTDEDRIPWLNLIGKRIIELSEKGDSALIACSALKESYRKHLLSVNPHIRFVYLKGNFHLIEKRLNSRKDHFFDPVLLSNQFQTLEEPEHVFSVDISQSPDRIINMIRKEFNI